MRVERSTVEQVKARFEYLKNKVKAPPLDLKTRIDKIKQEEEEAKLLKKERKRLKKEALKQNVEEVDQDMAAIMGFGGFGSTKT